MASIHYSNHHTSVIAFIRIREPLQKFAIRVIFDKEEKLSQAIDPQKFACQKTWIAAMRLSCLRAIDFLMPSVVLFFSQL